MCVSSLPAYLKLETNVIYILFAIALACLPNDRMLNIWLNALLRLWYEFEVRKFLRFVRFTFRVK